VSFLIVYTPDDAVSWTLLKMEFCCREMECDIGRICPIKESCGETMMASECEPVPHTMTAGIKNEAGACCGNMLIGIFAEVSE
jgi:hypothetical protein